MTNHTFYSGGGFGGHNIRIEFGGPGGGFRPPAGISEAEVQARVAQARKEEGVRWIRALSVEGAGLTDKEFRNVVRIAARVIDTQEDPLAFALRWVRENRPAIAREEQG